MTAKVMKTTGRTKTARATHAEAVAALKLPSPRALERLIERGAPGPIPGKRGTPKYDVPAIEAWRQERQQRLKPGADLSAARAKLAGKQTEWISLKLREAKGRVVRVKDVEHALLTILTAFRAEILSVSRRAVLAGLPLEHEALIRSLNIQALQDLSEVRTASALLARGATHSPEDAG
ncbi:MAG: hypothetical protein ABJA98_19280 [Acidobacteriota bacterium]